MMPLYGDFPGGIVVKNLPINAGDAGDMGSIPGLEDSLEKEMATYSSSSILAWKIPWIEGLQYMGLLKSWTQRAHFKLTIIYSIPWLIDGQSQHQRFNNEVP